MTADAMRAMAEAGVTITTPTLDSFVDAVVPRVWNDLAVRLGQGDAGARHWLAVAAGARP
jgi:hypothetical protein